MEFIGALAFLDFQKNYTIRHTDIIGIEMPMRGRVFTKTDQQVCRQIAQIIPKIV